MTPDRRSVLKGLGTGTAMLVGGVGTGSAQGGDAKVRLAHASPDAGTVEVYLDGGLLTTFDLGKFFPAGGSYLEVPAGDYEVTLKAVDYNPTVTVDLGEVTFPDGDTTFAAIGEVGGANEPFEVATFEGALGVLDDSRARVKFVHASPDAPPVDVALYDEEKRGLTLASNLSYGTQSDPVEVTVGETYPVAVFPAGSSDPVFGPIDFEPEGDTSYTVFAEGYLSTDGEPTAPDSSAPEAFGVAVAASGTAPFGGPGRGGRGR